MRTLVVGIPLPHVTFDNYTFVSAPAFSEYQRLLVETSSISAVVEDVVAGEGQHHDFVGHAVHNAPSTPAAFSLQQLLEMRRRETEWFFARGGLLVCFAHPDVAHPGITGLCGWRRYSWLPAPPGFRYEYHLLPGFGTPGAEVTGPDHPFAHFISALAPRLAYRATIDETAPNFSDYGRILARRISGGVAIAAELALGSGRLVLLPPLLKPEADRASIADALFTSLERFGAGPVAT
jgi:hypothetical protein